MCKKILLLALVFCLFAVGVGAYTLISDTNLSVSGSGTSWYFGPTVNVSVLWWDSTSINSTSLYLNYTLLREGVDNVTASNDWENITRFDGGNYSFQTVCTPSLENVTGAWENTSVCNESGFWDVIRYITEYDVNGCVGSTNTTYNQTNTTTCFYCWPLDSNLTLGQTFNISLSCCQVHNWSNGTFGGYLCDHMENEEYEENKMFLAAIMISPLILGFLLLWIASSLTDEHTILKSFFHMFTFISFFLSMYLASVMVGMYLTNYEELVNALTLSVFVAGSVFFILACYYGIWLTREVIDFMAKRKQEREGY